MVIDKSATQFIAIGQRFLGHALTPDLVVSGADRRRRVPVRGALRSMCPHDDRPGDAGDGKEPMRTLARHRQWDHKTFFGIRIIPVGTGTIRVGDGVSAA
jgi:hypothetical protein